MRDLPEVNDDFMNMMHTVRMMHIPEENIFAFRDVKFAKVKEIYVHTTNMICACTRSLSERTGILCGITEWYIKGIEWIRIKNHALMRDASLDFAVVSFGFDVKIMFRLNSQQRSKKISKN